MPCVFDFREKDLSPLSFSACLASGHPTRKNATKTLEKMADKKGTIRIAGKLPSFNYSMFMFQLRIPVDGLEVRRQ